MRFRTKDGLSTRHKFSKSLDALLASGQDIDRQHRRTGRLRRHTPQVRQQFDWLSCSIYSTNLIRICAKQARNLFANVTDRRLNSVTWGSAILILDALPTRRE